MKDSIENIDFIKLTDLPVTEKNDDFLAVGHNMAGETEKYPLGNLATTEHLEEVENAKANKTDLDPINTSLNIAKSEIDLLKKGMEDVSTNYKGIHGTKASLESQFPKADNKKDWYAFVGTTNPREKYLVKADGEAWFPTGEMHSVGDSDLGKYFMIAPNKEYAYAIVDIDNKLVWGKRWDGTTYDCDETIPNAIGKNSQRILQLEDYIQLYSKVIEMSTLESNPEWLKVWVDENNAVLAGIRKDGSFFSISFEEIKARIEKLEKTSIDTYEDIEERLELTIDLDGRVVTERHRDGLLREKVGVKTPLVIVSERLNLEGDAMSQFQTDLRNAGFGGGKGDQSDNKLKVFPFPTGLTFVNLELPELPSKKTDKYEGGFEFWDLEGNYTKDDIILSTQGTSTQMDDRKGLAFKLVSGAKIQWGNVSPNDSYHLKSHGKDSFRGISNVMYDYYRKLVETRPYAEQQPFNYQTSSSSWMNGTGDMKADFGASVTYIAHAFPCAVYHNGKYQGIYNITQKKDPNNYGTNRENPDHIWMDGVISETTLFDLPVDWTQFEIRVPKPKTWMLLNKDNIKYDWDGFEQTGKPSPELYNGVGSSVDEVNSKKVRDNIESFRTRFKALRGASTDIERKEIFEGLLFEKNQHDYIIFSNVVYNHDGFRKNWQWYTKDGTKWGIGLHDCDLVMGVNWRTNLIIKKAETELLGIGANYLPTYWAYRLYKEEFKARYKALRDSKVVSTDYIVAMIQKHLDIITPSMLQKDLEMWSNTPSYRESLINENWQAVDAYDVQPIGIVAWSNSTSYTVGTQCFVKVSEKNTAPGVESWYIFEATKNNVGQRPIINNGELPIEKQRSGSPLYLGFYNSVDRVRKFLDMRIALLDAEWGYN